MAAGQASAPPCRRGSSISASTAITSPGLVQDQVFYQIFPDRFCNGDPSLSVKHHEYEYGARRSSARPGASRSAATKGHGACEFYGGDLAGIDAKLHYLQSLG